MNEMTRSRRTRIRRSVVLVTMLILFFQLSVCDDVKNVPLNDKSKQEGVAKHKEIQVASVQNTQHQKVPDTNATNNTGNITFKASASAAAAANTSPPVVQHENEVDIPSLNTGALKRAVIVTFGLCGIVMVYIVFRSFRVNKSRPQMVRKYGILAHRQDVEMRPLPLDEDDDDDTTVFDASTIAAQRLET